jgi:predicted ATPase with chaperone activity
MSKKAPEENGGVHDTLVGMKPVEVEEPAGLPSDTVDRLEPVRRPRAPDEPPFLPEQPRSIRDTGLGQSYLDELCLKHLFQAGDLRGNEMGHRMCLPGKIVEEVMGRLRKQRLVDLKGSSGAGLGHSQMIFTLTEAGHAVCHHSLERDHYIGPAPVPFQYYLQAVAAQSIRGNRLRREDIEVHFDDLVMRDETYDAIGPAMNSGKALFFYGPPGNGKTAICQRMTNCFGGDVFIPHALLVDDFVIKVFDETIHRPIPDDDSARMLDERWVRCHRPMVVVGGELVLDDLDLSYSSEVKYYEGPFQLKANCGMLLIDDFGRQKVSPKDLLNRWIVPLESEFDFLSMHTGKKLKVPFDVFVVFSTNLDPAELVDAAFLRRVRYKLEVARPEAELYTRIFEAECGRQGVVFDPAMLDYLLKQHYQKKNLPFNACEPRDLLAQVVDLCAYRGIDAVMSEEILDKVVANYFVKFE